MTQAGVLGATGATGGELLRLLAAHPELELAWASSRSRDGEPVSRVHPNLADVRGLTFSHPDEMPGLDVLFCATPHGTTGEQAEGLRKAAGLVVDLSSDFRLDDPATYESTYGQPHPTPDLLDHAEYGLPELSREGLAETGWIAGPGCIATATQLALAPLAEADLLSGSPIVVDAKVGSTAGGGAGSRWSSHPTRTATVRPYAPTGHRHEAEIRQNVLGPEAEIRLSAHAVDMPRGVLATVHLTGDPLDRRELQRAYQTAYAEEPFVELLAGRARPGGVPEPRFVAGTNRAQVAGLPHEGGAVALCAIDNLGKGAAGTAVQSANLALGLDETTGLDARAPFP